MIYLHKYIKLQRETHVWISLQQCYTGYTVHRYQYVVKNHIIMKSALHNQHKDMGPYTLT